MTVLGYRVAMVNGQQRRDVISHLFGQTQITSGCNFGNKIHLFAIFVVQDCFGNLELTCLNAGSGSGVTVNVRLEKLQIDVFSWKVVTFPTLYSTLFYVANGF